MNVQEKNNDHEEKKGTNIINNLTRRDLKLCPTAIVRAIFISSRYIHNEKRLGKEPRVFNSSLTKKRHEEIMRTTKPRQEQCHTQLSKHTHSLTIQVESRQTNAVEV